MMGRIPAIFAIVIAALALTPGRAEAEVKFARDPEDRNRLIIVSDGPSPWKLRFYDFSGGNSPFVKSWLVPVNAERTLFAHGLFLHLIDTKNGVLLSRWFFSDQIAEVRVEGEKFHVRTVLEDQTNETFTLTEDSPSPPHWMHNLIFHRVLEYEGTWFSRAVGLEPGYDPASKRITPRKPLPRQDAERLLVEVEDAVRRDRFHPQLGVCLALLMRDLGRKSADDFFRNTIERPTNAYGELFLIAEGLEDGGDPEWAALAFEAAYTRMWQQGVDPRMMYGTPPRLVLANVPYDLRLEIPDEKRVKLVERLYRIGPYIEGSYAGWSRMGDYLELRGDPKSAAIWRVRAGEAAAKNFYAWESIFNLESIFRAMVTLVLCVILYYIALQRRYAPQRRLNRGGRSWLSQVFRLSPLSMTCWDRRDRVTIYLLFAVFWLLAGLSGAFAEAALNRLMWPIAGSSGSLRAPVVQAYLKGLPPSPDRDSLLALSLQQAERHDEAESLYRDLPNSAWKWNNLGVLQASAGRTQESAISFEQAVSLDSTMPEAAFNLGRPVTDLWVELHARYLPGKKMLAAPHHDVFHRAQRGSYSHIAGRAARGPYPGWLSLEKLALVHQDRSFSNDSSLLFFGVVGIWGGAGVFLVLFAGAIISAERKVSQSPGRFHWLLELLLPGTSRQWGYFGGLVLAISFWAAIEFLTVQQLWTTPSDMAWGPFEIAGGVGRTFGLPPSSPAWTSPWPVELGWFWETGTAWLAVAAFAINAILVISARLRGTAGFRTMQDGQ
jgi:tetratricopeptide (TPR) repeat protein